MTPYVGFRGDCEQAFALYERCLGATRGATYRYAGTPLASNVPADWGNKVMHGSVTIGGQVLMGGDVAPGEYEKPAGISLSLNMASVADAERIFAGLSHDGKVIVPLAETFWAPRFGVVEDPFGIRWMVNCEAAEQPQST